MRGVPSEITRTPKGFSINGHPIVSGSTFDCLGLALLMTLTKLFSRCSILMLDEVGAGADEKRAAMMLGTLAGAGFSQVFFITHRNTDESASDNLLEVA
jgi:ABC-type transport system involved in cytochrome bd biosynthesis fused ATPase/permease subunit